MAYVTLNPNDSWMDDHGFDSMLRKFKKKVDAEGILKDYRKKEFYIPPSEKRKLKKKEAQKRRHIAEMKRNKFYSKED